MSIKSQLKKRAGSSPIDLGTDDPLFVRSMSGADRSDYMDMSLKIDEDDKQHKTARKNAVIFSISLVDKKGVRIYGLDEIDEIIQLPSSDIDKVVNMSMDINKLSTKSQAGQEKN